MTEPIVDVVIPVHSESRPVARAAASVLATATVPTRVTVVCHNIEGDQIARSLGAWADDARVRLLTLADGISSPAGPINAGLDAATAEFTALLGSDDEYEPGAIDAWVAVARRDEAQLVIPPLRTSPGALTRSPPVRPFRTKGLDGVRDRLAYRTVQLGLVERTRFGGVRMTTGLRTGEDVVQGATLWYSGARISLVRQAPGYLIHEDDPASRVSSAPKPAAESLLFLDAVLAPEFVSTLTPDQQESFAVKLLRTHVMDILAAALCSQDPPGDLRALAAGVRRILDMSPRAMTLLSRREAGMLTELSGTADPARLSAELTIHTDYRRPANLIPAAASRLLHREAPLRFLTGIAFMR
ncbi:MAG: glycosyltransferase family A protein [Pseudolysinimonas sp.]